MRLGYFTTLSVEYDAVKLGLDASLLEVAQYQAALHNIPDHDAEIYFLCIFICRSMKIAVYMKTINTMSRITVF